MAELSYVKQGERIGAHTVNGIIDAIGGPNIPTDEGFVKTSNGSLFQRRDTIGSSFNKKADTLFDVKWAEAPRDLSCEYKMLYIQLGRNFDFIKNRLDVDQIWSYDGDSEKGINLSNSFEVNGAGRFYDGFVNTQLSALQKFPYPGLSVQSDPQKIGYGDGHLYGVYVKGNAEDNSTKKVFVITNEYESDNVKNFVQLSANLTNATISKITKLAVCTPAELTNGAKDHYMGSQLIKLPNEWSTETDEDIRFRLRGKVETNDSGQYKWKIECYNGLFINDSTKDEDTGVRYNTHKFNDITPNKGISWTQISASDSWESSISKDINVYMNLTCTIEPATGSGEEFNGQYLITTSPAAEMISRTKEGAASLSATYVIGTVKFRNEIVDVQQNMLGNQTFIELFNADALSAALADLSSDLFKVDTEISALQLSSIERHEYKNKDGAVIGTALELYQFHNIENSRAIDDNDKKFTDFIVRKKSENGLPAEVQYLNLSSVLNQMSGNSEISGDSQISTLQLSSVVFDTITHKITDEQGMEKVLSAQAISLFNFNNPNSLSNNTNPWQLSAHDFVLRKHDGDNMYLEYWSLSNMLSTEYISTDSQLTFGLSSLQTKQYDKGKYHQIFGFEDLTNGKDASEIPEAQVLVRNSDGHTADIQYVKLSSLSGKISVDTDIVNQTSSIQLLSTQTSEWYQLYNFNKTNADVPAKIWTLGDLDSDKHGKTGKLIDPTTKKLLSVDILVRDNSTKQLKYMNLSVDPINVDTYATNTKNKSIVYHTDKFKDRDYLTLHDFNTTPETKLSATINNNGLVDVTGQNTWILTKKYNPSNQMMELTYDRLQLSVNLSSIQGACISGDTNVITTRKSIDTKTEGNNTYHQLHNFDNPNPTTKTVDMRAKNTAYDTLDSNEYFVIKSGNELKYKKVQIKDNTPGGGGSTTGYSGNVYGDPRLKYNTNGQYQIELWAKKMTYANGLLTNVGEEELVSTLPTTPLTQEIL